MSQRRSFLKTRKVPGLTAGKAAGGLSFSPAAGPLSRKPKLRERLCALTLLLIGAVFLPLGCSKAPERPAEPADAETAAGEPETPAAAAAGYAMRVGMWLYTADPDTGAQTDLAKAAQAIPLGERLELVAPEPRQATNAYDNKVYDYYVVRRDTGTTGMVFANQITRGSVLAAVSDEKANLYRSPRNIDVTDYILPRKTVLGAFPETEKDGFVQIEAYDPVSQTYRRNLFIKTASISYRDQDVQSLILLQTAEALDADKEQNRREALLNSALDDYPDSNFADEVRALIAADTAVPARETDASFWVTDDNVNVRKSPDVSSELLAQLSYAAEVRAVEETVEEFNVDGRTARWYHIEQPADGWVFGAWLESAQ
ncbi:MAG: SH3 domain-containing protein [Treponema sp.]|jgi:hypothetical protein|nr:SH3 domain-containing protein [Treponema sp.]